MRLGRILITGSSGYLGRHLLIELISQGYDVWGADLVAGEPQNGLQQLVVDLSDDKLVRQLIKFIKPDCIIHAAAYKFVDTAEDMVLLVFRSNVLTTQHLVNAALENQVKHFLYIGTDKAVAPVGVMGLTKRISEDYLLVKSHQSDLLGKVLRIGNIYGSDGSIIPKLKQWTRNEEVLQLTDLRALRYYVQVADVIKAITELMTINSHGKWLMNMGDPMPLQSVVNEFLDQADLPRNYPKKLIGLRTGEKLVEILLEKGELTIPKTKLAQLDAINGYYLPESKDLEALIQEMMFYAHSSNKHFSEQLRERFERLYEPLTRFNAQ